MTDSVTYRLSSIDNSLIRTYIRCCFTFPCSNKPGEVERITQVLSSNLKRAVSYMPMLAGSVHPAANTLAASSLVSPNSNHTISFASCGDSTKTSGLQPYSAHRRKNTEEEKYGAQRGRLEVRLVPEQLKRLEPSVAHLSYEDFSSDYNELASKGMPAMAFVGEDLAPLADAPDPAEGSNAAFAVKASFIDGGVVVAVYLHHSVGDAHGLAAVVRNMSISEDAVPSRDLTTKTLRDDAEEQSRTRDRLSGSRGVKAHAAGHPESPTPVGRDRSSFLAPTHGTSRVLFLSMTKLKATTQMLNERAKHKQEKPSMQLSIFDCLTAILWKALTRARWVGKTPREGQASALLMPMDIRQRIEPALSESYYGNASLISYSSMALTKLCLPFDISSIASAASTFYVSRQKVNDVTVRSAIAIINEQEDVRGVNRPVIDFEHDVFITDWSNLPSGEEASLGLGLGPAQFVRKPSRQHSSYGCIILPPKREEGVWEVLVQMTDEATAHLLEDLGLKPFVRNIAR